MKAITNGNPEPLLDVEELSVRFDTRDGPVHAVQDVSFTVRRGEVVGIVGESGCGKSVTASSIAGLLPPSGRIAGGTVVFDGLDLTEADVRSRTAVRGRRIGMIFQHPKASLDPTCRVGHQIAEPLRLHLNLGRSEAWERAVELLATVGIPDPLRRARAYPYELSGGMAQRVLIASAIACEPELLIADEPTTAVDVTVQAQLLRLLKDLCSRLGLAVLVISHDLGVVASLAQRVYVMYAGRIVEEGPVHDVLLTPSHPYTRALLQCCVTQEAKPGDLMSIPGTVPTMMADAHECTFVERCSVRSIVGEERCRSGEPPLFEMGPERRVRCWAQERR
jgi:oligopeptide/dipeptide ABC transporter ATP-binding protein